MKKATVEPLVIAENTRLKREIEKLKAQVANVSLFGGGLLDSEARYRNLVELAVDAIIMGDSKGNIIGANQSAVSLTGYPLEELLGKNLSALFSEEEHTRTPLRYDLLKAGKAIKNERNLTRKDGTLVPIGMNSRMMPDGTYHTFIRDFTELKANEEKMRSLIQDLDAFAGTVSHDLRTLISSLLVAAEILEPICQRELSSENLKVFGIIQRTAQEMASLVENLIALTLAGNVEKPEDPIDPNVILRNVLEALSSEIEAKNVSVSISVIPRLKTPESFISQIFLNLIENALKYGSRPGESIEVGGEQMESDIRLWVKDHGPGLAQEDCERIFDVFYRSKFSKNESGAGIGLAVVKKIALGFDGDTYVEKTPGGGCTFNVILKKVID